MSFMDANIWILLIYLKTVQINVDDDDDVKIYVPVLFFMCMH